MEFLSLLRDYSDVLLLGREDPWTAYQTQLKKLHDLGMLNLSLTPLVRDAVFLQQVQHKIRSLNAQLRESKKKVYPNPRPHPNPRHYHHTNPGHNPLYNPNS